MSQRGAREPGDASLRATDLRDERDAHTERLLEEIATIEDRLDPRPRRRGERLADLTLVALILIATLLLDLELRYPILLIALLLTARGVSRLAGRASSRSLRKERDRLLEGGAELSAGNEDATPEAP